jgi:hypothetical protein
LALFGSGQMQQLGVEIKATLEICTSRGNQAFKKLLANGWKNGF